MKSVGLVNVEFVKMSRGAGRNITPYTRNMQFLRFSSLELKKPFENSIPRPKPFLVL